MAKPIVLLPDIIIANGVDGPGSFSIRRTGRTQQAKPYNLPTAYRYSKCMTTVATKSDNMPNYLQYAYADRTTGWPNIGNTFDLNVAVATQRGQAINAARDKFMGSIREEAMLAVNWAERKQAISMITDRANQLLRFTRAIKRGRLGDAADALRLPNHLIPSRAKWHRTRSAASTFLEFHFGWDPLVKDIYSACGLLSAPVSWPRVEVTGRKVSFDFRDKSLYDDQRCTGSLRASMGATVRVSNPNLWLLNQLGLLNPAAVVWERAPWSFLVDWVLNVSQWLDQWTDLSGLTLTDAWYTVRGKAACTLDYAYTPRKEWVHVEKEATVAERTLGVPGVTLGKIPYKPLSAVRAATAVSLLAQKLPSRESYPTIGERRFKNIAHPAWYGQYLGHKGAW